MELIKKFLDRNAKKTIFLHVIGDSVVDECYKVKVTRISPESPNVCVMVSEDAKPSIVLPGGAANICYQLKNFNVRPRLFSLIDDEAYDIFVKCGISFFGRISIDELIPRKKRFYDGNVQVSNRWDVEKKLNCQEKALELIKLWQGFQAEPDVVIISDYDKGLFKSEQLSFFNLTGKVVIVDPKKPPLEKWKGCTIFKPNANEAFELSGGLTHWIKQCDFFQDTLGCQSVVITQEGRGVVGKFNNKYFEYVPGYKVTPSKITGAGDCFVGVLALAVAHGFPVDEAAIIAFEAGLLYVQANFNEVITPWQFQKQSKFATTEELKNRNYKLVFANGCYDILHAGHLETLKVAKSNGDKLVVAVNSDASVSRLKGSKRPVVPLQERMDLLAALECVDYVISFDEDTPLRLIEDIRPDVLVKGADWKDKVVVGSEIAKEVIFIPLVEDKSTTNIIEKIKSLSI
jgi:D-beta-D-heptose 7-phosphate kinase/D-beta-D-heptose 1-phosphate adenosyltransferase